jgi:hypothetical protein
MLSTCEACDYNFPFNEALSDCTLAHLKSIQSYERTIAELREQIERGEERRKVEISEIEEIIHRLSYWHQGEDTYLDYKKECHYCNDRPWLNKIASAIHALLAGKKGQNEKRAD